MVALSFKIDDSDVFILEAVLKLLNEQKSYSLLSSSSCDTKTC